MVHKIEIKKERMITMKREDGTVILEFWKKVGEIKKPSDEDGSFAPSPVISR